jgi:hypothetical protein
MFKPGYSMWPWKPVTVDENTYCVLGVHLLMGMIVLILRTTVPSQITKVMHIMSSYSADSTELAHRIKNK